MRGATRPKQAWVAWPTDHATPLGLIWPLSIVLSSYLYECLWFDEKGTPYFSHIFLRRRRRRKPSSTSRRADLLLPVGNHRHHRHRLLLGVGGSIFITNFIIPNISTISTSGFNVTPLIVCGRSNPAYCLSVVCMFVLGNLSIFCG
jgi:hypothetical protein